MGGMGRCWWDCLRALLMICLGKEFMVSTHPVRRRVVLLLLLLLLVTSGPVTWSLLLLRHAVVGSRELGLNTLYYTIELTVPRPQLRKQQKRKGKTKTIQNRLY